MKDRDYLWCLTQMLLDREEELEQLCPACRAQVEQNRCSGCGAPLNPEEGWENPSFDLARFQSLKRGEGR